MLKIPEYIFKGAYAYDGAGVKLKRIFGGQESYRYTDPFLLLDNFGSSNPEEYLKGFPWHPHRGIETVTYAIKGKVSHRDSEDNSGIIYSGDVQWMTAGSGIFHEEMPHYIEDKDKQMIDPEMAGFQLWINIPAREKMKTPVYRPMKSKDIPVIRENNIDAKVISGIFDKVNGKYSGGEQDISYYHIKMEPESSMDYLTKKYYKTIIYTINGEISINNQKYEPGNAIIFSIDGSEIRIKSDDYSEFLLLNGKPIKEDIFWYGPIVMNNRSQIEEAINDLNSNKFIRDKKPVFE